MTPRWAGQRARFVFNSAGLTLLHEASGGNLYISTGQNFVIPFNYFICEAVYNGAQWFFEVGSLGRGPLLLSGGIQDTNITGGQFFQTGLQAIVSATTGTTLTSADLTQRNLFRYGPTAPFTDTTDTATNIIAAIQNAYANVGGEITIVNQTADVMTLAAGTGVTIQGTATIAASSTAKYLFSVASLSPAAVTFIRVSSGGL
jgi:hypothetical protein